MKTYRFSPIVFLILLAGMATGQIPNSGFENWIDKGTHLNPAGWWTTNDSVISGDYYPVTPSVDHFPPEIGTYSMRMENHPALLPEWAAFGIAWTGDFNGNDHPVFPVTGHPTSLWGYYKFFPQNGDTMEIHIRIYDHGVEVCWGSFKTAEPAEAWTPFSMTFSEYLYGDSARIFISTCYDNDEPIPKGNSIMYLDNLSFDSLITTYVAEVPDSDEMVLYPNPASDYLIISLPPGSNSQMLDVEVIQSAGIPVQALHDVNYSGQMQLDISQFPAGIYYLRIIHDGHMMQNKVVVLK